MRRALALLFVIGCSSSSEVETLCNPADGVLVAWMVADANCLPEGYSQPQLDAPYMSRSCHAWLDPLFDAGAVALAADKVAACQQALEISCSPATYKDWLISTAACGQLVTGTLELGGACSSDVECAATAFCDRSGTCGTCTARRPQGSACTTRAQCASQICGDGHCLATKLPSGATCSVSEQCSNGLSCVNGSCVAYLAIGQSCAAFDRCDPYTSSCTRDVCTALSRVGQACISWSVAGDAPRCRWFAGEGCIAGTCQVLPRAAPNMACGFDVASCAAGSACAQDKCWRIADEGEPCGQAITTTCGPFAACVDGACTSADFDATCVADDEGLPFP
ncbi:MAG TPA: Dickkopf N-terminal cysteine-rich domain-containing protein [Kofleriaceae bacterium]